MHKNGNNANVGSRAFTAWKPVKIQWKMLPPVGIEPRPLITSDSKSSTILSTLTCHVLLRRSCQLCLVKKKLDYCFHFRVLPNWYNRHMSVVSVLASMLSVADWETLFWNLFLQAGQRGAWSLAPLPPDLLLLNNCHIKQWRIQGVSAKVFHFHAVFGKKLPNKNAFQYDVYRLLQWPSLDATTGGLCRPHPPMDRMTDGRFWKYYLPLRSVIIG